MIYLVTNQTQLFENEGYKIISVEKSIEIISSFSMIQADSETDGKDPHINNLVCFQFGDIYKDIQIVVDCASIDIKLYKDILESKYLIFQNAKFDLQFLYKYNIIPTKIYDTMIVEQLLYLGYPKNGEYGGISYALNAIAKRRLNINLDKTIRSEIIWRGLDSKVIEYAANDVIFLYDIMQSQLKDCKVKNCLVGAKLECDFVPAIAYLEWCGIKLDESKWKSKMKKDQFCLEESKKKLDDFIINNPLFKNFVYINSQGDLFEGFDNEPKCSINWASPKQVIQVAKMLGFDTQIQNKKTGENSESVIEKHLKNQKGINDDFLNIYFTYKEKDKVVSSFGQTHLDSINPITGRLHTTFKQLGASSGRMSCGSNQSNTDLAKYKKLNPKQCKYPNLQQLPANEATRSSFVAEEGNMFVSCDYSAQEARLSADIYQDKALLDIFLKGIDSHSMYAKIFFKEELKDIEIHDIKKLRPDLRQKAKGPEFALNFGGGKQAIMQAINCTENEAETIIKNYEEGFKGTANFAKKGSKFVREHGYVLINPITGHRLNWWDFKEWKERQKSFNSEFWDNYKNIKKLWIENGSDFNDKSQILKEVSMHFKAASKYDRMVRNSPTQGTAAIITKQACIDLFNWILEHNMFNKIKLCVLVHDEINCEYPKELESFPSTLQDIMEKAAAKYCKSLPIPAEPSVNLFWVH